MDKNGNIVDYGGDVHVCIAAITNKTCSEIIRETLEELDVDGIFFNMGGYVSYDYSKTTMVSANARAAKGSSKRCTACPFPRKRI